MNLPAGTRLGVYEVTALIGEGGMGQVYRATDTTLGRQVAIKMLPAAFAADPERVARFEREAKTLASLNHPHIAAIYGFEKTAAGHVLVMELVAGEDLAQRLRGGPIAIDEALPIARQIADAIAAAHERGIVHRDLKPANVKTTPDGVVKVLDFGLAKAFEPDAVDNPATAHALAQSPTITTPAMTQAGMILGTAAYMSPEQAKGRAADKRSDIWSFGCVLYEMLTGEKAFAGEDVSETLAAILRADPDVGKLPAIARPIVEGCLKKDRKQRFADIAVVQHLLNHPQAGISGDRPHASRWWMAAAALLGVTTIAAIGVPMLLRRQPSPAEITRFEIAAPAKGVPVAAGRTAAVPALSPDGRRVAYTMRDESGLIQIWIRQIDLLDAQPLRGSDNAEFPFWSPDGKSLGFFADGKLKRIEVDGGAAQIVCDALGARGGSWSVNGDIVIGGIAGTAAGNGLSRVPATGGELKAVTKVSIGDHRFPSFLPDGRHLFFFWQAPGAKEMGLYVTDIDSGEPSRIADADTSAVYVEPGFILFGRQNTLIAQPFDAAALKTTGAPVTVTDRLESGVFAGIVAFAASTNGSLAYGIGSARTGDVQVTWFDRQGKALSTAGAPGNYMGVELSPDGKQIAVHRHDNTIGGDLWTIDVARGAMSRLTFEPAQDNAAPVWTRDSRRIVFTSLRNGAFGIYVKSSNGLGADQRVTTDAHASPRALSHDGKWLFYVTGLQSDIWAVPFDGSAKPIPLLTSQYNEANPSISPDGKWLAYASNETGRSEIYVRSFPGGDGKWQISTRGGIEPRWRGDSKELFFLEVGQLGSLMSVDVDAKNGAFQWTSPRALFKTSLTAFGHPGPQGLWRYDVTADGQRFLMAINPRATTFGDASSSPMVVVLNWMAALKK